MGVAALWVGPSGRAVERPGGGQGVHEHTRHIHHTRPGHDRGTDTERSADTPLDPSLVRRLTRPLMTAAPGASAIAIGLHREGQRAFVLHGGTAHGGGGVPVETATRFEVGSVTKTFTTLLLAEQAGPRSSPPTRFAALP